VITLSGLVMAILGFLLYFLKKQAFPYMPYLLMIPPIGVASYVFVFNISRKYNGLLPTSFSALTKELLLATAFATGIFLIFTVLLLLMTGLFKKYI